MTEFPKPRKGRGAASNPPGRFERVVREAVVDAGMALLDDSPPLATRLMVDRAKQVIATNDSPDLPFDRSVNPYRGCEHGCVYCYARPSHAYLGLSPGLDFETQLFYKPDAAECLERELARPGYVCRPIALGVNTDAWQPVERRLVLTRRLLEVLVRVRHPVSIVTKSALIERDLDLLADLARDELVHVFVSLTTLDEGLARRLEPRAARPAKRLAAIEALARAGVPVGVMVAPVIPVLTDHELEGLLAAARERGACAAAYAVLRLPHEVKELFAEWLANHRPAAAEHVMSRLRSLHGGREYDARFGTRMTGQGIYARLLADRFHLACKRARFPGMRPLRTDLFAPPKRRDGGQLELF